MKIGIIGLGFMGAMHFNAWKKVDGARISAICTRSPVTERVKQGNIDSGSEQLDLDGVTVYTSLKDMLANEGLDAVSITLPTHLHKDVSIECLHAGVHVLCEKPMALNLDDCEAMIHSAASANKELMIAHCIRFWPEYAWLKAAVDSQRYGTVKLANFERLTYAPTWSENSWFSDPSKSGGIALDLLIHDLDYIQYLFGSPKSIESQKLHLKGNIAAHVHATLDYGSARIVTATASWLMPKPFGFKMSFKVIFDKAVAIFNGDQLEVFPAKKSSFCPELDPRDGYTAQVAYFAQRIRGEATQTLITAQQAAESVRMALATNQ